MAAVRTARAAHPTTEPVGALPARLRAVVKGLGGDARRREKAARELADGDAAVPALAEGPHLLAEALGAGRRVRFVVATERASRDDDMARVLRDARERAAPVYRVTEAEFARVAATRSPQGVLAVVDLPPTGGAAALADLWGERRADPAVLFLAGVQDPGNVGSLARTARAAGAALFATDANSARADDAKTLRASQGALFHLARVRVDALAAIDPARAAGARVAAAVPRGGVAPWAADLKGPVLLVLGGEGGGLDDAVARRADVALTLPMAGGESLGVAAAGAAILYERLRQCRT